MNTKTNIDVYESVRRNLIRSLHDDELYKATTIIITNSIVRYINDNGLYSEFSDEICRCALLEEDYDELRDIYLDMLENINSDHSYQNLDMDIVFYMIGRYTRMI